MIKVITVINLMKTLSFKELGDAIKARKLELYVRNILMFMMTVAVFIKTSFASGFYGERYRGWLWFEEPITHDDLIRQNKYKNKEHITPQQAKEEIEKFRQELDDLRYVMIARPTVQNIKAYKKKEEIMMSKGILLSKNWVLANVLNPELADLIENPVNVHAVKMKRKLEAETNEEVIREFANSFDLVFFFKGNCKYCHEFAPVLKNFSNKYGFITEAISMDGSEISLFQSITAPELVKQLNITAAPTVVAVKKDSSSAFELIRGYVTISELEEYTVMVSEHLKNLEKSKNTKNIGKDSPNHKFNSTRYYEQHLKQKQLRGTGI